MKLELLERAKEIMKAQHKSPRTQQAYVDWVYRFLLFHQKDTDTPFSVRKIETFLAFLQQERKVSAATHNQALQAVLFLYKQVLHISIAEVPLLRSVTILRLPEVLSRLEIKAIISHLKGDALLMTSLMYGCGLRLLECLSLRVKDVRLDEKTLIINDGKKERVLAIPNTVYSLLSNRMKLLRLQYENWLQEGFCGASLPEAVQKASPQVALLWPWQYLFPSERPASDPISGTIKWHHRSHSFLEKAIKQAALKAKLTRSISCHIFRHSFAAHLLDSGYDIRIVQKLLGHMNIRSTMVYARLSHLKAIRSPLDELNAL